VSKIYLDNAATTKMKKEVLDAMLPYFSEFYGNPSSIYGLARENKKAIDESRETIANAIGALKNEIYFTSGGSEADNWAIKGICENYKNKGNHIITTAIEHHAVLNTCEHLEKNGFEVTYLSVGKDGIIDMEDLKKAIKKETILISIIFANNEIGTIQPIKEIGEIAKANDVIFHTDAVQAVGQVEINVKDLNIDLLSMTAHKLHGPKGIGALYIKKGVKPQSIIHGGEQELGKRAGTENVAGIVGFAKAVSLATENMEERNNAIRILRDKLTDGILNSVPHSWINGSKTERLANNANISFEFVEGEGILLLLDMHGICASSGSACTSGSLDPSHVLLAIGLPHEKAHGSLRLTLSDETTAEEVNKVIETLPPIVQKLREMSPLYEEFLKNQN